MSYVVDHNRKQIKWTEEERATANKLRDEGYNQKEIAEKIGRTHGMVRCLFSRQRMIAKRGPSKSNVWSNEDIERAKALLSSGKRQREIGKELGRSWQAIQRLFRRLKDPNYRSTESAKARARERKLRELRARKSAPPPCFDRYKHAPDHRIAEYESRCAEPMTLAQRFLGDPEPSRSALYRSRHVLHSSNQNLRQRHSTNRVSVAPCYGQHASTTG